MIDFLKDLNNRTGKYDKLKHYLAGWGLLYIISMIGALQIGEVFFVIALVFALGKEAYDRFILKKAMEGLDMFFTVLPVITAWIFTEAICRELHLYDLKISEHLILNIILMIGAIITYLRAKK